MILSFHKRKQNTRTRLKAGIPKHGKERYSANRILPLRLGHTSLNQLYIQKCITQYTKYITTRRTDDQRSHYLTWACGSIRQIKTKPCWGLLVFYFLSWFYEAYLINDPTIIKTSNSGSCNRKDMIFSHTISGFPYRDFRCFYQCEIFLSHTPIPALPKHKKTNSRTSATCLPHVVPWSQINVKMTSPWFISAYSGCSGSLFHVFSI